LFCISISLASPCSSLMLESKPRFSSPITHPVLRWFRCSWNNIWLLLQLPSYICSRSYFRLSNLLHSWMTFILKERTTLPKTISYTSSVIIVPFFFSYTLFQWVIWKT
jgi:hypothetical protein